MDSIVNKNDLEPKKEDTYTGQLEPDTVKIDLYRYLLDLNNTKGF